MVGTIASPSKPSVRFTALDVPTTTIQASSRYHQPRLGLNRCEGTKGKVSRVSIRSDKPKLPSERLQSQRNIPIAARKKNVWSRSFFRPARPLELFLESLSQSSRNPIRP